jgi:hypothetical protein
MRVSKLLQPSACVSSKSRQTFIWNGGESEEGNNSENSEEEKIEDDGEEEICSEFEKVDGKNETEDSDGEIPFWDEAGTHEPEYDKDTLIKPDGSRQALTFKIFREWIRCPYKIVHIKSH